MKKLLPKAVLTIIFIIFINIIAVISFPTPALGQITTGTTPTSPCPPTTPDCFVEDEDVKFAGKAASRSSHLLNWIIANYKWSSESSNFSQNWIFIRNIVYASLGLFILVAAFLLIATRGKSLTVRKFIPRFILSLVLVTLSFSIVQFLYQIVDLVQGFFLKKPGGVDLISDQDLLHVGFTYSDNFGFRKFGSQFDESVFISVLLTKLTAITYYVMFAILIIRKVILWFFLVVSPIFPLLLLFPLIRNSAKLWIGEFFRWVLYGPLFAIFLAGLVALWIRGIPLDFASTSPGIDYQTATDILLAGPGKAPTIAENINTPSTFILYVVALLMVWMVIILPFILLKIFLDYFQTFEVSESNLIKYLVSRSSPILERYKERIGYPKQPTPAPSYPQAPGAGIGQAKAIPTFEHFGEATVQMPQVSEASRRIEETVARNIEEAQRATLATPLQVSVEEARDKSVSSLYPRVASVFHQIQSSLAQPIQVMTDEAKQAVSNLTNLVIPTMHDIPKLEVEAGESGRLSEVLSRIAEPQYTSIKEQLVTQAQRGNPAAFSVLSALTPNQAEFPEANRVQKINLDDYEKVKKIWTENYKKLEPPISPDGKPMARKQWLLEEIKKIPEVIDLLLSGDPQKVKQGKEMMGKILPFLLLGGFSKAEIIAYLKAKLEAAKTVLNEILQVEGQEATKVEVERKVEEKPKEMAVQIPQPQSDTTSTPTPPGVTQPVVSEPKNDEPNVIITDILKSDKDKI